MIKSTRKAANKAEKEHMAWIKTQPCIICEKKDKILVYGVECDHIVNGYRLGHFFCLPLCLRHHRGEDGYSGKNRATAWDMSLKNQLAMHEELWERRGLPAPVYQPKRANTSFHKQLWER